MSKDFFARRRFLGIAAAGMAVLMLSGCFTSDVRNEWPPLSYGAPAPVTVSAARIDIIDAYRPPMGAPNVDHLFRVTPAQAAQELVREKVVAGGSTHLLRVIVEEASVRRETLPQKKGMLSLLSSEPDEKFDARVALRFELAEELAPDIVLGRASVVATRERTLKGGATLAEREKTYHGIVQALLDDLAQGVSTTVGGTFGKY
jgi:hypothetical protein